MFVIKSYGVEDCAYSHNIAIRKDPFYGIYLYNNTTDDEKVISPVIHPRLLLEYRTLNLLPAHPGIKYSFFCPSENSFKVFDGTRWANSPIPVHYTIANGQELIRNWFKDLQIHFTIPPYCSFFGFKLAFNSAIALEDYLLEFALPLYMKTWCKFNFISRSEIIEVNRSQIPFDIYFTRHNVRNLKARAISSDTIYELEPEEGHIVIPDAIEAPFLVSFEALPKIDYVSGSYQIAEIPSVIIRKQAEEDIRKNTSRYDSVLSDGVSRDKVSKDILALTYNLLVEVIFVAPSLKFAQMMFESIVAETHEKPIYIAPIDDYLGFLWNTDYKLKEDDAIGTDVGTDNISTLTVTGKILNVPVTFGG